MLRHAPSAVAPSIGPGHYEYVCCRLSSSQLEPRQPRKRNKHQAGKGDHKHVANAEAPYKFNGPEALLEDFWSEVDKRRR